MSDAPATAAGPSPRGARARRRVTWAIALLLVTLALLLVPDPRPDAPIPASGVAFTWNQDSRWEALEARSAALRALPPDEAAPTVETALSELTLALDELATLAADAPAPLRPPHLELLARVEESFFEAAAVLSAHPARAPELVAAHSLLRQHMKRLSLVHRPTDDGARRLLYRALYGSRAALEEVLLQMPADEMPVLGLGVDEPSATPGATLRGVRVHSGDILVSRGGAPTSALIARGNDYPGNFSHVALLSISEDGTIETVESHIERGVVVADIDHYIHDRKLRVMLLRPRASDPALVAEPLLPARAAARARDAALARHIPYDFAGDRVDHSEQFCSEVVSSHYGAEGLQLWEGLTTTSDPDTARWLAAFGVREFETHGPSDLEYDPKLVVVAEWRDPGALFDDHIDAAVVDALLEGARRGDTLTHRWWMLPVARALKAYSWVLNRLGRVGPVPEGMSATVALRVQALGARHAALRAQVERAAAAFQEEHGYRAPYWDLVRLAREAHDR